VIEITGLLIPDDLSLYKSSCGDTFVCVNVNHVMCNWRTC